MSESRFVDRRSSIHLEISCKLYTYFAYLQMNLILNLINILQFTHILKLKYRSKTINKYKANAGTYKTIILLLLYKLGDSTALSGSLPGHSSGPLPTD